MITDFRLDVCRDSAVIYSSVLEQIEMLYEDDTELAGEFAIAAIQTVLSGETTTDNKMIRVMLKQLQQSARKNQERYESSKESKREYRAKDLRLNEIAELANEGLSIREIEQELDIPKSTVSYRIGVIKNTYPELLDLGVQVSKVSKLSNTDTDTDTVTDTDTYTETSTETETETETSTYASSDKPNSGAFAQAQNRPVIVPCSTPTYSKRRASMNTTFAEQDFQM